MQFKLNLVSACIGAFAVATQVGAASVKARQNAHLVYVTTDVNFTGDQLFQSWVNGTCGNFPEEFQDDITSIAPVDTTECYFWKDVDCPELTADFLVTWTDPVPDLSAVGDGSWNDAIKSFTCYDFSS